MGDCIAGTLLLLTVFAIKPYPPQATKELQNSYMVGREVMRLRVVKGHMEGANLWRKKRL